MKNYKIEIHTTAGIITGPEFPRWIDAMKDAAEYSLQMEEKYRLEATFKTVVIEKA